MRASAAGQTGPAASRRRCRAPPRRARSPCRTAGSLASGRLTPLGSFTDAWPPLLLPARLRGPTHLPCPLHWHRLPLSLLAGSSILSPVGAAPLRLAAATPPSPKIPLPDGPGSH